VREGIESFGVVKGDEIDMRMDSEKVGDRLKNGNKCSSSGARGAVGKLVREVQRGWEVV
jgi:hypothetical protein